MALSRAKSAGGEGRDPDFAFHEDVLINNDRKGNLSQTRRVGSITKSSLRQC